MVALDNKNGVIFIPLARLRERQTEITLSNLHLTLSNLHQKEDKRSILYYMLANFPSPISERVEVLEKAHCFSMSCKGFF